MAENVSFEIRSQFSKHTIIFSNKICHTHHSIFGQNVPIPTTAQGFESFGGSKNQTLEIEITFESVTRLEE
jgi:hypothetical protein